VGAVQHPTSATGPIRTLGRRLRRCAAALGDLVYPRVCALCDTALPDGEVGDGLCGPCAEELRDKARDWCRRCGASVGPYSSGPPCYWCGDRHYHFDGVCRLGAYEGLRRDACLKMKGAGGAPLATAIAALLWRQHAERLQAAQVDLVVPVPLHWRRRLSRRHNPAETLAARLARRLHRRCLHRMLKRWRATASQSHLPPTRRWENVRGAFRVRPIFSLRGARILLVDDVLTTGATCSEAAGALKKAGAERVQVVVVCRGEGAS
jgi:ComF family protein